MSSYLTKKTMADNDQEMRAWLEREGMVMTREQDAEVRQWLEDNDAHLMATIERGYFAVLIYTGRGVSGAAESRQSLGEAVRLAQHLFDLRVIELVKSRSHVVGRA